VTRALLAVVAVLAPVLVAAADPSGDVAPCPNVPGGSATIGDGEAPDLVQATGEIVELGTSALFTLRFAEHVVVPDRERLSDYHRLDLRLSRNWQVERGRLTLFLETKTVWHPVGI